MSMINDTITNIWIASSNSKGIILLLVLTSVMLRLSGQLVVLMYRIISIGCTLSLDTIGLLINIKNALLKYGLTVLIGRLSDFGKMLNTALYSGLLPVMLFLNWTMSLYGLSIAFTIHNVFNRFLIFKTHLRIPIISM
jgi:hypothetical protein